jgi:DNA-binding NtrC family response regulator
VAQAIRDKAGVIRSGIMSAEQTGGSAENRLQLAAPLMHEGSLLGVIYIDAREQVRPYRMNELRLLAGMAQLTADFLVRADARSGGGGPAFSGAALDQMRRDAALVGNSAAVGHMRAFAAKAAAGNGPILLHGPPGTGKAHLSRLVHLSGPRAAGPLVVIHGPAMAKSLTEAEIFGQEIEGAAAQIGRVEWAQGGTLFIDQLNEMSSAAQERLFQVISKGQFVRIGSDQMRPADCRVVISSNTDPKEFVGHRLFYQPLVQALGEALFEVPSLAARREDIPMLAEHFLEKARTKADRKLLGFSEPALNALSAYGWPGNLGELSLAVQYAVFHGRGREIVPDDLPDTVMGRAAGNGRGR